MSDLVDVIRAIVRDELTKLRLGDIGIVTTVYAHAEDSDDHNYECNVKLRESDLELRKVPMATPHAGMVSAPQVDDLVLVSYVGGDPERPIVVGRLYSDARRPPVHAENEWRVESPLAGASSLAIDADEQIVATAGETILTLAKDGSVTVAGKEDLVIAVAGNAKIECCDCTIKASGTIALGENGDPVITQGSHKCYYTGAPLVGSTSVSAKG